MLILIQILLGWYLADLITGIYHYFVDNYGSAKTPIFGSQIEEFQIHHHNPKAFLSYSWWESLKLPLLGSTPLFLLAIFNPYFFLPLAIGIAICQLTHKWSHESNPPTIIKCLQKMKIILSPEDHDLHHTTFDSHYCIVSGWANPLLDFILRS